jgi:hypothetical protein
MLRLVDLELIEIAKLECCSSEQLQDRGTNRCHYAEHACKLWKHEGVRLLVAFSSSMDIITVALLSMSS